MLACLVACLEDGIKGNGRRAAPQKKEAEEGQTNDKAWNVHVKEDAGGFSHALSKDARSLGFKVELSLGDGFGCHDVPGHVLLHRLRGTHFQVMGLETVEVYHLVFFALG